jgi:DNA modification methylase
MLGTFIDWRALPFVHASATALGLTPLDLIVWAKTNASVGSLYSSQHEFLPLFKKGSVPHVNNTSVGKRGRRRSNLWTYPSAASPRSYRQESPLDHWPEKPADMLERALIDLTNPGDIVLDPFLGSGAILMAAENSARVCRGIELDPLHIDVVIRRYEAATGKAAVLTGTDETFTTLAARRAEGLLILTAEGDLV